MRHTMAHRRNKRIRMVFHEHSKADITQYSGKDDRYRSFR